MSMEFFGNAGAVCLIAAAAAFILAMIMFFAFDIPTIVKNRKGLAVQAALHASVRTGGKKETVQEVPFRIVRKIIITDSDDDIDLPDIFNRQDPAWEVGNEKHKEDDNTA